MNWRAGVQVQHDETTDEICILVRRIVPAIGGGNDLANANGAGGGDPFEGAHPHLRRTLEQATAADPCAGGAGGLHLTRIRGQVGAVQHAQSDVRSYSAPGDAIHPTGRASANTSGSASGDAHPALSMLGGMLGSDIADSSWMSWM